MDFILAALDMSLIGPLINMGAVGICLVALAGYYIRKDRLYEARIDQRLEAEEKHRKELADMSERYRLALERFNESLDAVLRMLPKRRGE